MATDVRLAEKDDVETLARLNRPVQQLHTQLYPQWFKPAPEVANAAEFFAGIIAAPSNVLGICEAAGEPLGYIWAERQHRAETPFCAAISRLYIHHVSVIEEARRRGVASSLLDWAIQRARSDGIKLVALDHWAANEDAHAFFSQRGFKAERIVMSKLSPSPGYEH